MYFNIKNNKEKEKLHMYNFILIQFECQYEKKNKLFFFNISSSIRIFIIETIGFTYEKENFEILR